MREVDKKGKQNKQQVKLTKYVPFEISHLLKSEFNDVAY